MPVCFVSVGFAGLVALCSCFGCSACFLCGSCGSGCIIGVSFCLARMDFKSLASAQMNATDAAAPMKLVTLPWMSGLCQTKMS